MKHIIITGHYGSGKSNIAITLALEYAKKDKKVFLIDCDIVNPYFRSADSKELLENNGVELIAPMYANTNLDIPALPADIQKVFAADCYAVWDIGGDDSGAVALGQFAEKMSARDYEMILVINRHRLLTSSPEEVVAFVQEMEAASRMHFTGIANNSNLGPQTTCESFAGSVAYAQKVSELTGLPILMHSLRSDLAKQLSEPIDGLFPIEVYGKKEWKL